MTDPWIRIPPRRSDHLQALIVAGAVAAGVGLATFYITRTLLARENLFGSDPPAPPPPGRGDEGGA